MRFFRRSALHFQNEARRPLLYALSGQGGVGNVGAEKVWPAAAEVYTDLLEKTGDLKKCVIVEMSG